MLIKKARNVDVQYLALLHKLLVEGEPKDDRTGTGTYMLPGFMMEFDLADGFPLLTTKKLYLKGIILELLWMLSGDTNIKYLNKNNVHIWDDWADENGDLGAVYGEQWRACPTRDGKTIDQISNLIHGLKTNPNSRRHIVSAWNAGDIAQNRMSLPSCHCFFQFYFYKGRLHLTLYQRSCDVFLGVPFNIASYALLLLMVSQVVGAEPGTFRHVGGDTHLYKNHKEQAQIQLKRDPRPLPIMKLNPKIDNIFKFKFEDIELLGYNPHPKIKAEISV